MGKGGYTGGSSLIGPGSSWFSRPRKPSKSEIEEQRLNRIENKRIADQEKAKADHKRLQKEQRKAKMLEKRSVAAVKRMDRKEEIRAKIFEPRNVELIEEKMRSTNIRKRGIEVVVIPSKKSLKSKRY